MYPRLENRKVLNGEFINNKLYEIFGYSFLIYKMKG